LINPRNDGLAIEAEATTRGGDLTVELDGSAVSARATETVVKYVARTQETVILDDALPKIHFLPIHTLLSVAPAPSSVCH
jgi:hypothetical protein